MFSASQSVGMTSASFSCARSVCPDSADGKGATASADVLGGVALVDDMLIYRTWAFCL